MSEFTVDEVLTALHSLPYPEHVSQVTVRPRNEEAVRFTWRSTRYRVSLRQLSVEEAEDGLLATTQATILMEHLLRYAVHLKRLGYETKGVDALVRMET